MCRDILNFVSLNVTQKHKTSTKGKIIKQRFMLHYPTFLKIQQCIHSLASTLETSALLYMLMTFLILLYIFAI